MKLVAIYLEEKFYPILNVFILLPSHRHGVVIITKIKLYGGESKSKGSLRKITFIVDIHKQN
jgi:hypothetical protein